MKNPKPTQLNLFASTEIAQAAAPKHKKKKANRDVAERRGAKTESLNKPEFEHTPMELAFAELELLVAEALQSIVPKPPAPPPAETIAAELAEVDASQPSGSGSGGDFVVEQITSADSEHPVPSRAVIELTERVVAQPAAAEPAQVIAAERPKSVDPECSKIAAANAAIEALLNSAAPTASENVAVLEEVSLPLPLSDCCIFGNGPIAHAVTSRHTASNKKAGKNVPPHGIHSKFAFFYLSVPVPSEYNGTFVLGAIARPKEWKESNGDSSSTSSQPQETANDEAGSGDQSKLAEINPTNGGLGTKFQGKPALGSSLPKGKSETSLRTNPTASRPPSVNIPGRMSYAPCAERPDFVEFRNALGQQVELPYVDIKRVYVKPDGTGMRIKALDDQQPTIIDIIGQRLDVLGDLLTTGKVRRIMEADALYREPEKIWVRKIIADEFRVTQFIGEPKPPRKRTEGAAQTSTNNSEGPLSKTPPVAELEVSPTSETSNVPRASLISTRSHRDTNAPQGLPEI